jgi:hypothetical protein
MNGAAAVLTMHPTLLIGPADWDSRRMPQAEFDARIAKLWQLWPQASGALIYGDSRDHAALAYLTHFTPKLEPSIALIPRNGAPTLMVGGGANMIPAAKPLTWVSDLVSLRPTGKTIAQWREGLGSSECVCIGIDAMPTRLRRELDMAFGGATPEDRTADWWQGAMRAKSPRELECIRAACATLQAAGAALAEAKRKGAGVTETILDGEHVAIQRGAQEVRSLFSLDGGRTLRPFSVSVEQAVDPLQVYIAVRHAGYWADGFVVFADKPPADPAKAQDALRRYLSAAEPGAPVAAPLSANGIGLALEEPVSVSRLEAGGVYSVRATHGHACVSAMVAVSETGVETLWLAA